MYKSWNLSSNSSTHETNNKNKQDFDLNKESSYSKYYDLSNLNRYPCYKSCPVMVLNREKTSLDFCKEFIKKIMIR